MLEMFEGVMLARLLGDHPELNTRQNCRQWIEDLAIIQARLMAFQFDRGGSLGFGDGTQKCKIQEDWMTRQGPSEDERLFGRFEQDYD